MRRATRGYYLIEVVPRHWLHQREQTGCSLGTHPDPFLHLSHICMRAQSAAATVAVACASVRWWLAATVATAWWQMLRRWWFRTNRLLPSTSRRTLWCYCVRPADAPFCAVVLKQLMHPLWESALVYWHVDVCLAYQVIFTP
ncbi:hypothetical protein Tco_0844420 [Tanacetum coccineum]